MTDNNQFLNTKVMNKWVIDQYVGRGQSGVVYRAHDPKGEIVAVKIISIPNEQQIKEGEIAYGGDPELMESFFEQIANKFVAETESLKRLSNSSDVGSGNIVRYIDHVASKRDMEWEIIIVMEFVRSLKDYLAENKLTVGTVVSLGIDIATGLEHCQRQKVIHRDIKDDNIFADERGTFKIGDFGVANMYTATRASTKVGTPYYMAPEVQKGAEYTANVDVYSLGVVLYKLLNYSRFPFAPSIKEKAKLSIDDNDRAFKRRMAGEILPDPEFCPDRLKPIIRKACEYDPKNRYTDAAALKEALVAVRNMMPQEEWETELPAPARRWVPGAGEMNRPPVMPGAAAPAPQSHMPVGEGATAGQTPHAGWEPQNRGTKTTSLWDDATAGEGSAMTETVPVTSPQEYSEANDPGMKTTDLISSMSAQGGLNAAAAKKLMQKTQQLENAEGRMRGMKRKGRKLKAGVAAAAAVAVLAIAAGVFLWPYTISYSANSDDNYYLYRYQFGRPQEKILKEDGEPIPASYVKCDGVWIYFSLHDKPFSDEGDHRLYKVRTDGTGMVMLSEDHCEYNILYDGWIYYLNQLENNALYRVDIYGNNRQMLMDEEKITSMYMEKENGKIVVSLESGGTRVLDVAGADTIDKILISDTEA